MGGWWRALAALGVLLSTWAGPRAWAASPATSDSGRVDVFLNVEGGRRPLPLVLARFASAEADLERLAQGVGEALEWDLRHAARFEVLTDSSSAVANWEPLLARWSAAGARALVRGEVRRRIGRAELFATLYRLPDGRLLLARSYDLEAEPPRQVAHRLNDDLVLALTGQRGIASTKIAFVAAAAAGKEISLMDYDGYGARPLTRDGTLNLSPAWSPDGARIAYSSLRRGNWFIFLADAASGTATWLPTSSPMNTAPSWSPDGGSLAVAMSERGNIDLYRVPVAGRAEPQRLTDHPEVDTEASWSPDGRRIAFTSDRGGLPQVYISGADGREARRLTWEPDAYEGSPAWSPDSRWIAFVRRGFEGFELHVAEADGGAPVRLTAGASNENPSWSPDGLQLAFCRSEGSRSEIWAVNRDGSQLRPLTTGGRESLPAWSPWLYREGE